jgi:L-asparaginase II
MSAVPYQVAGRERIDTAVMQTVHGVVMKSGAAGLICAAVPDLRLGVAVKILDGSHLAAGPAIIRSLYLLEAIRDEHLPPLGPHARPPVMGGDLPVGEVFSDFDLREC